MTIYICYADGGVIWDVVYAEDVAKSLLDQRIIESYSAFQKLYSVYAKGELK